MPLIFYRAPMSTATVTELVLAELEVPHETVTLDLKNGDTKTPEFLKRNPNGKVPVIVHDGSAIWESSAITMYLGEMFGVGKNLYPPPGPGRGEAMKWIAWSNVTLSEALWRWVRNSSDYIPKEQHNVIAAEVAMKDTKNLLQILDAALEFRQFLCGDYTLADTHVNGMIYWARYLKIDLSSYRHLESWSQRCAARPAYGRVMAGG